MNDIHQDFDTFGRGVLRYAVTEIEHVTMPRTVSTLSSTERCQDSSGGASISFVPSNSTIGSRLPCNGSGDRFVDARCLG